MLAWFETEPKFCLSGLSSLLLFILYNLLLHSSEFKLRASGGAQAKNNDYFYPWIALFIFLQRDGVSLSPSEYTECYLYLTLCLSDLAPEDASVWQNRSEKIETSSDEIEVLGIGKGTHRTSELQQCL